MDENPKIEEKPETKTDLVTTNFALLQSQVIAKDELIEDLIAKLDAMTTRCKQAEDILEERVKSMIIAKLVPNTTVPASILALKTVDELKDMEQILSHVKVPTFVSGTPVVLGDKSPEAKLNSMFDEYASKTWRRDK